MPPERRIVLVRHPEHAVFPRAVLDAGRRARAAVQHSVMTANSFGFFLRAVEIPSSAVQTSARRAPVRAFRDIRCVGHLRGFYLSVKSLSAWFFSESALATMPCIRFLFACTTMFPKPFYKHLLPALLAGLGLRLFFIWHFPFYSAIRLTTKSWPATAVPRRLRFLLPTGSFLRRTRARQAIPAFLARIYFLAGTGRKGGSCSHKRSSILRRACWRGIASRLAADLRRHAQSRCSRSALADGRFARSPRTTRPCRSRKCWRHFYYARAADFFVACGMAIEPHGLKSRQLRGAKNLVRGRASLVLGLGALVRPETSLLLSAVLIALWPSLSRSRKLEKARGRNSVDDRWLAVAASALGRAQRREPWTRAVPRAALRGKRTATFCRPAFTLDENVDVSFSRCLSLYLETAVAADRLE